MDLSGGYLIDPANMKDDSLERLRMWVHVPRATFKFLSLKDFKISIYTVTYNFKCFDSHHLKKDLLLNGGSASL